MVPAVNFIVLRIFLQHCHSLDPPHQLQRLHQLFKANLTMVITIALTKFQEAVDVTSRRLTIVIILSRVTVLWQIVIESDQSVSF